MPSSDGENIGRVTTLVWGRGNGENIGRLTQGQNKAGHVADNIAHVK